MTSDGMLPMLSLICSRYLTNVDDAAWAHRQNPICEDLLGRAPHPITARASSCRALAMRWR